MDPNKKTGRFQTEDIVPEGAVEDEEFRRAVESIQDLQPGRGGWLVARGAFDKGDQAYLKEEEERRRHAEEAMVERERAEFLAARALAEQEERLRATGSQAPPARKTTSILPKKEPERKKRPLPVVKVVKPRTGNNLEEETAPKKAKAEPVAAPQTVEQEESEPEGEGLLAGLLGGYDSDTSAGKDDAEAGTESGGKEEKPAVEVSGRDSNAKKDSVLPSAVDLLE